MEVQNKQVLRHTQIATKVLMTNSQQFLYKHPNIQALIVSSVEQSGSLFQRSYMTYKILLQPYGFEIFRRYSEFDQLHSYLKQNYPEYIVPPIPRKVSNNKQDKTVNYRQNALENFVNLVIQGYWHDDVVNGFFAAQNETEVQIALRNKKPRSIELNNLETLNGVAECEVSDVIDSFCGAQKSKIEANQKQYKKIRQLTKKIIEDNNQLKRDYEELAKVFVEMAAEQQVFPVPSYSEANVLFNQLSTECQRVNKLLEKHVWHHFKYQSQVSDVQIQQLKQRETHKEEYNKKIQTLTVNDFQKTETLLTEYGYINYQIYQQVQLVLNHEVVKLKQTMDRLKDSLLIK